MPKRKRPDEDSPFSNDRGRSEAFSNEIGASRISIDETVLEGRDCTSWTCRSCTLQNSVRQWCCELCGSCRPSTINGESNRYDNSGIIELNERHESPELMEQPPETSLVSAWIQKRRKRKRGDYKQSQNHKQSDQTFVQVKLRIDGSTCWQSLSAVFPSSSYTTVVDDHHAARAEILRAKASHRDHLEYRKCGVKVKLRIDNKVLSAEKYVLYAIMSQDGKTRLNSFCSCNCNEFENRKSGVSVKLSIGKKVLSAEKHALYAIVPIVEKTRLNSFCSCYNCDIDHFTWDVTGVNKLQDNDNRSFEMTEVTGVAAVKGDGIQDSKVLFKDNSPFNNINNFWSNLCSASQSSNLSLDHKVFTFLLEQGHEENAEVETIINCQLEHFKRKRLSDPQLLPPLKPLLFSAGINMFVCEGNFTKSYELLTVRDAMTIITQNFRGASICIMLWTGVDAVFIRRANDVFYLRTTSQPPLTFSQKSRPSCEASKGKLTAVPVKISLSSTITDTLYQSNTSFQLSRQALSLYLDAFFSAAGSCKIVYICGSSSYKAFDLLGNENQNLCDIHGKNRTSSCSLNQDEMNPFRSRGAKHNFNFGQAMRPQFTSGLKVAYSEISVKDTNVLDIGACFGIPATIVGPKRHISFSAHKSLSLSNCLKKTTESPNSKPPQVLLMESFEESVKLFHFDIALVCKSMTFGSPSQRFNKSLPTVAKISYDTTDKLQILQTPLARNLFSTFVKFSPTAGIIKINFACEQSKARDGLTIFNSREQSDTTNCHLHPARSHACYLNEKQKALVLVLTQQQQAMFKKTASIFTAGIKKVLKASEENFVRSAELMKTDLCHTLDLPANEALSGCRASFSPPKLLTAVTKSKMKAGQSKPHTQSKATHCFSKASVVAESSHKETTFHDNNCKAATMIERKKLLSFNNKSDTSHLLQSTTAKDFDIANTTTQGSAQFSSSNIDSFFSTAGTGRLVQVSSSSLDRARSLLNDDKLTSSSSMASLPFASERKVSAVSGCYLLKTSEMMNNDVRQQHFTQVEKSVPGLPVSNTGPMISAAVTETQIKVKKGRSQSQSEPLLCVNKATFRTAGQGQLVTATEENIRVAVKMLDCDSESLVYKSATNHFVSSTVAKASHQSNTKIKVSMRSPPKKINSFFSNAGTGQVVRVSDSSLRNAHCLLNDSLLPSTSKELSLTSSCVIHEDGFEAFCSGISHGGVLCLKPEPTFSPKGASFPTADMERKLTVSKTRFASATEVSNKDLCNHLDTPASKAISRRVSLSAQRPSTTSTENALKTDKLGLGIHSKIVSNNSKASFQTVDGSCLVMAPHASTRKADGVLERNNILPFDRKTFFSTAGTGQVVKVSENSLCRARSLLNDDDSPMTALFSEVRKKGVSTDPEFSIARISETADDASYTFDTPAYKAVPRHCAAYSATRLFTPVTKSPAKPDVAGLKYRSKAHLRDSQLPFCQAGTDRQLTSTFQDCKATDWIKADNLSYLCTPTTLDKPDRQVAIATSVVGTHDWPNARQPISPSSVRGTQRMLQTKLLAAVDSRVTKSSLSDYTCPTSKSMFYAKSSKSTLTHEQPSLGYDRTLLRAQNSLSVNHTTETKKFISETVTDESVQNDKVRRKSFSSLSKSQSLVSRVCASSMTIHEVKNSIPFSKAQRKIGYCPQESMTLVEACSRGIMSTSFTKCLNHGVSEVTITLNSKNASTLRFHRDTLLPVQSSEHSSTIGTVDDYCIALKSSGINNELICDKWIQNHVRWIVWKLASLERRFSYWLGGHYLTFDRVLWQLKKRYEVEICSGKRSAIRQILNRDAPANFAMILCVADVKRFEQTNESKRCQLELSDGWYSVWCFPDSVLQNFINDGLIQTGTKLMISNGILHGFEEGTDPLDSDYDPSAGPHLKIFANSTRIARWNAKLGFVSPSRCFNSQDRLLQVRKISDILQGGGCVPLLDIVVEKKFARQYLLKETSLNVKSTRCRVLSESEESTRVRVRESKLLLLVEKYTEDVEEECMRDVDEEGPTLWRRFMDHISPSEFYDSLIFTERKIINDWQEKRASLLRKRIEDEVSTKLEEFETELIESTPFIRVQISSTLIKSTCGLATTPDEMADLTIWNPSEEQIEIIQEGTTLRLKNVTVRDIRYDGRLQLSANSRTRITPISSKRKQLTSTKLPLTSIFKLHLISKNIVKNELANFERNFDVYGIALSIRQREQSPGWSIYLIDGSGACLRVESYFEKDKHVLTSFLNQSKKTTGSFLLAEFRNLKLLFFDMSERCVVAEFTDASQLIADMCPSTVQSLLSWASSERGHCQISKFIYFLQLEVLRPCQDVESLFVAIGYITSFRVFSSRVLYIDVDCGGPEIQTWRLPLDLIQSIFSSSLFSSSSVLNFEDEHELNSLTKLGNIFRSRQRPYRFGLKKLKISQNLHAICRLEVVSIDATDYEAKASSIVAFMQDSTS